jgi:hypothetical protein
MNHEETNAMIDTNPSHLERRVQGAGERSQVGGMDLGREVGQGCRAQVRHVQLGRRGMGKRGTEPDERGAPSFPPGSRVARPQGCVRV